MRHLIWLSVALGLIAGCNEDKTEVVAGPVLVRPAGPGKVQFLGQFEIRKTDVDRSVIAASRGGACLVAHLAGPSGVGIPVDQCNADSDCDLVPDPGQPGTKWHGYCMPDDPATLTSPKRCWVKPSDAYCKKGLGVGPAVTPRTTGAEVYAYAATHLTGGKVSWRVNACLNGPMSGLPPCAGGDGTMMRDYGPIITP